MFFSTAIYFPAWFLDANICGCAARSSIYARMYMPLYRLIIRATRVCLLLGQRTTVEDAEFAHVYSELYCMYKAAREQQRPFLSFTRVFSFHVHEHRSCLACVRVCVCVKRGWKSRCVRVRITLVFLECSVSKNNFYYKNMEKCVICIEVSYIIGI